MYQETKMRSVVKAVLWRITATLIAWGTLYYYTGKLAESIEISVVAALILMTVYYAFERIWNKVSWGKEDI